jgi:hypothetical protein
MMITGAFVGPTGEGWATAKGDAGSSPESKILASSASAAGLTDRSRLVLKGRLLGPVVKRFASIEKAP